MSSSHLTKRLISSFFLSPCQFHHLLRSPLTTQAQAHKDLPFLAQYLISSFGFSVDRALKASADSAIAAIKSPARPDSVIKFLADTGLSHDQIKAVVSRRHKILGCNVDKTLQPKVRQLREQGFTEELVVDLIRYNPVVLELKDTLPRLLFWRDFVGDDHKALVKIIRSNSHLFTVDIHKHILPRINLLKECGLSCRDITTLFSFQTNPNLGSLRYILELIKEIGIPRESRMFLYILIGLSGISTHKLKAKMEFFKSTYGWSQQDVYSAFRMFPLLPRLSEDKVRSKMDFLMRKAGFDARSIVPQARVLAYSLERVLIPRYTVLSALESKGLKKCTLSSACQVSEGRFRNIYVVPFEKDVPGLGEAYAAALAGKVSI